jgi:hypothetical protein
VPLLFPLPWPGLRGNADVGNYATHLKAAAIGLSEMWFD